MAELKGRSEAIEPDAHLPDDEEYQESSTSSMLTSVASEIKRGKVENGRTYTVFGSHDYYLPIDDDELDRLDLNHHKYTLLMNDRLFLAPLPSNPQHMLDIGCGTGIFAVDLADAYPSARVIGTDLAPVQSQWVPPNCHFHIDDAEAPWTFARDSFDYIHARDLYHSIRDWPALTARCFAHVRPGGYCEFAGVWAVPEADDGTLDPQNAYVEFAASFQEIGRRIACEPDAPTKFKDWFEQAGFEDVTEVVLKIPSSPWPKDPRLKKVGALEFMNVVHGASSFMDRGWTKEFGSTREELEVLLTKMRKELMRNKFHSYVPFYVVTGRKPNLQNA